LSVLRLTVDSRYKYDRNVSRAWALAYQRGRLVSVEARHVNVHQDHNEVLVKQSLERLCAGIGSHDSTAERTQHSLESQQIGAIVIDNKDARCAFVELVSHRGVRIGLRSASGQETLVRAVSSRKTHRLSSLKQLRCERFSGATIAAYSPCESRAVPRASTYLSSRQSRAASSMFGRW
jgi:hypothetical protein